MLKITLENPAATHTLKLEGKLAGPWVDELERVWRTTIADMPGKRLVIDLCDVVLIDAEGRKLLKRMYQEGAQFKASGCLTNCIVEEIERDSKPG